MTREELNKMLEEFAICVLTTYQTDMATKDKEILIRIGMDLVTETVMLVNDRKRITRPSAN